VSRAVGESDVREFVTIHGSTVGDGCSIYERTSIKKSHIEDHVDLNAGSYVENAAVGPNCSVVGVTHDLDETGMTYRDDAFERVILGEGCFLGAGAVVAAGAVVTGDVAAETVVLGVPPEQHRVDLAAWLAQ